MIRNGAPTINEEIITLFTPLSSVCRRLESKRPAELPAVAIFDRRAAQRMWKVKPTLGP